ncbi:DJ-1/PfpI family protein [Fictibacillus barbaricus]|uniref:Transcriptional regulator GlxA family with amidase domain n=1 Tax=Fictibacillus barbaricus TaxID=182136 RepID=A0ABU1U417_9BACL|nr:DJ-1/PfpI family protein [Fictibacillus barbaricus]MDR7074231.1 transcriptional regulator GlxA family with amidase domain [Fictibacillus barbaricus]
MAKNVLLYVYPNFKEIEVVAALSILNKKYDLHTFSLLPGLVQSACGLTIKPSVKIKNIQSWNYDMLILPGGETTVSMNHHLMKLLHDFNREKITIAAIGEGVYFLSRSGLLKGRTYTTSSTSNHSSIKDGYHVNRPVIEDQNLITAKAHAFIDFGLLIGDRMNCIESINEYNFYKGIK